MIFYIAQSETWSFRDLQIFGLRTKSLKQTSFMENSGKVASPGILSAQFSCV